MSLVTTTITQTAKSITTRASFGTAHTPITNGLIFLSVELTALNGAAATITADVEITRSGQIFGAPDARFSVTKRSATSTRETLLIGPMAVLTSDFVQLYLTSTNASDTVVAGTIRVYDAQQVDVEKINSTAVGTPGTAGNLPLLDANGNVPADLKRWLAVAPTALTSGRVEVLVGAMATNVITASSINTGAISAAAIANNAFTAAMFNAVFPTNFASMVITAGGAVSGNVVQFGGVAGTFAGGRAAVNVTHIAGSNTNVDTDLATRIFRLPLVAVNTTGGLAVYRNPVSGGSQGIAVDSTSVRFGVWGEIDAIGDPGVTYLSVLQARASQTSVDAAATQATADQSALLTAIGNVPAFVWTYSGARALTTFGTLVADVVAGVWNAATRSITSSNKDAAIDAARDAAETAVEKADEIIDAVDEVDTRLIDVETDVAALAQAGGGGLTGDQATQLAAAARDAAAARKIAESK